MTDRHVITAAVSVTQLSIAAGAAFLGGIMNAVAGGGTLLTFPSLIAAGLSPLVANATSTVALLPGALSSMLGYRNELTGARRWTLRLALPSLIGGLLGAFLLLRTPDKTFERVVPWLVLGATTLFLAQRPLLGWIRRYEEKQVPRSAQDDTRVQVPRSAQDDTGAQHDNTIQPTWKILGWQTVVGMYGGYFGAGVGILMLAALGFMGFTNIHRMNGLKNWGGFCMNSIAAATFAVSGIVDWPVALSMAVGAIIGGYVGSRMAQRVPQHYVRGLVGVVGVVSGIWLLSR